MKIGDLVYHKDDPDRKIMTITFIHKDTKLITCEYFKRNKEGHWIAEIEIFYKDNLKLVDDS